MTATITTSGLIAHSPNNAFVAAPSSPSREAGEGGDEMQWKTKGSKEAHAVWGRWPWTCGQIMAITFKCRNNKSLPSFSPSCMFSQIRGHLFVCVYVRAPS